MWQSYGIDVRTRTVYLDGEVGPDMLRKVYKALHLFRGKACHVVLNSQGGDDTQGLAICDLFRNYTGRVSITVVGSAESMAAVILQSADRRLITPNSYLMYHQGELSTEMTRKNLGSYLKLSDHQDDVCDALVLRRIQRKHPKYTWEQFRSETGNDTYFTAEQALRWGLVDKIVGQG